jgi:hypothetical protein
VSTSTVVSGLNPVLQALMEESDRTDALMYPRTEAEDNQWMDAHCGQQLLHKVTLPEVDLPMSETLREPVRNSDVSNPRFQQKAGSNQADSPGSMQRGALQLERYNARQCYTIHE